MQPVNQNLNPVDENQGGNMEIEPEEHPQLLNDKIRAYPEPKKNNEGFVDNAPGLNILDKFPNEFNPLETSEEGSVFGDHPQNGSKRVVPKQFKYAFIFLYK